ncbi:MAG: hypothetical protein JEY91_19405, partial [Spirochaetaceae bacterium]|nr:hypothetical protein [Spirochaetaceae bacterium]
STVLLTDIDGNILWQNDVTPFGEETGESGFQDRDGFYTGKKIDRDTGLYYFNARWYDPGLGRFITEDPVKDGVNWFSYVGNNPLRYVDPTGLRRIEWDPREENKSQEAERERVEYNRQMDEALAADRAAIEERRNAMRNARSIAEAASLEKQIREDIGKYNRFVAEHYAPDSVEDYGGTKLTGSFDQKDPYAKNYKQDPHPGIDFTGGDGFETPFYTEAVGGGLNGGSNPAVLSVIGTPYRIRAKHSDSEDVQTVLNDINTPGKTYAPGENIIPYPERANGTKAIHFHVEVRTTEASGASTMRNPIGLTPGTAKRYLYDYGGDRGIDDMVYNW